MGDPAPVRVPGPRTVVVRHCPSTRIPLPSHAAAAACLSQHLARQPFGTRRAARRPSSRTRQGPLPVPHDTSRHDLIPATPGLARQARGPSRALAASLAVVVRLPPRATAIVAYGALRCVVDRLCCCVAARHSVSTLGAAITRRALRPGNVACGDRCVRGTIPPRHHAGINDLVSTTLGATGRKAAFAPRHYRISRVFPWDTAPRVRRSATSPAGSDGALRLRPPARQTPPPRGSWSRWRGSPPCRAGRGSPPAGRSGRSRRPSAAPASRCRDHPPAPPRCGRGPRASGDRRR